MSKKETILKRITELAFSKYPDSEIYLYGSRARGDSKNLSDWDLLILLNAKNISFEIETKLMDEFYELELETGEIFSTLVYSKTEWSKNHSLTPLFENIQKEGIRIK
jgi:predicted nucleotidyltransferase